METNEKKLIFIIILYIIIITYLFLVKTEYLYSSICQFFNTILRWINYIYYSLKNFFTTENKYEKDIELIEGDNYCKNIIKQTKNTSLSDLSLNLLVEDYKNNCRGIFNNINNTVFYKNYSMVGSVPSNYERSIDVKHPLYNKWYKVLIDPWDTTKPDDLNKLNNLGLKYDKFKFNYDGKIFMTTEIRDPNEMYSKVIIRRGTYSGFYGYNKGLDWTPNSIKQNLSRIKLIDDTDGYSSTKFPGLDPTDGNKEYDDAIKKPFVLINEDDFELDDIHDTASAALPTYINWKFKNIEEEEVDTLDKEIDKITDNTMNCGKIFTEDMIDNPKHLIYLQNYDEKLETIEISIDNKKWYTVILNNSATINNSNHPYISQFKDYIKNNNPASTTICKIKDELVFLNVSNIINIQSETHNNPYSCSFYFKNIYDPTQFQKYKYITSGILLTGLFFLLISLLFIRTRNIFYKTNKNDIFIDSNNSGNSKNDEKLPKLSNFIFQVLIFFIIFIIIIISTNFGVTALMKYFKRDDKSSTNKINIIVNILNVLILLFIGAILYLYTPEIDISGIPLLNLIKEIVLYIPCITIDFITYVKKQLNLTTKITWIILAIEAVLIFLRVIIPIIIKYKQTNNAVVLLDRPIKFNSRHIICNKNKINKNESIVKDWIVKKEDSYFDFDTNEVNDNSKAINYNSSNKNNYEYNYSISMWVYINRANSIFIKNSSSQTDAEILEQLEKELQESIQDDTTEDENNDKDNIMLYENDKDNNQYKDDKGIYYTNLFNYNYGPSLLYNAEKNLLKIKFDGNYVSPYGIDKLNQELKTTEFILNNNQHNLLMQKWNNIVINYNSGNLDIFINNKLTKTIKILINTEKMKKGNTTITIGDNPIEPNLDDINSTDKVQTIDNYKKYFENMIVVDKAVKGGICNIVYYHYTLDKKTISELYNFFKNKSPPTYLEKF